MVTLRFSKPKSWQEAKQRLFTQYPIFGYYLKPRDAFLIMMIPNSIIIILAILGVLK